VAGRDRGLGLRAGCGAVTNANLPQSVLP